jgi:coenzyme F420-reducing hydrogenase gamma subunit
MSKISVSVHKFSSCDGCQLAFLNLGTDLLSLPELLDIKHFAEAGPVDMESSVDIAFVEGSISTPDDLERIKKIRENSNYLITIGACATSGGIQALRNLADTKSWITNIYANPEYINSLDTSTPISDYVKVDFELWGCPINSQQLLAAIRSLLFGVEPLKDSNNVCMECKRRNIVCVMITKGVPCMGPITQAGCGALCPSFGRDCYACYGPAENANTTAHAARLAGLGLVPEEIAQRYLFINSNNETFKQTGVQWKTQEKVKTK